MKIEIYHSTRDKPSRKKWSEETFISYLKKWKWTEADHPMADQTRKSVTEIKEVWSTGRSIRAGAVHLADNIVGFNWPTGSLGEAIFDTTQEAIDFWKKHIGLKMHRVTKPIKITKDIVTMDKWVKPTLVRTIIIPEGFLDKIDLGNFNISVFDAKSNADLLKIIKTL